MILHEVPLSETCTAIFATALFTSCEAVKQQKTKLYNKRLFYKKTVYKKVVISCSKCYEKSSTGISKLKKVFQVYVFKFQFICALMLCYVGCPRII